MQSLASFFEENRLLASGAVLAAVVVLLIVVTLLYRLVFGRRPRAAANGRNRQPRLGIVDAYDLDRQRQLVLVRRDNVEHLIMIGGPTDVVVESSIVRTQAAGAPRDKEVTGPLVGTVAAPSALPSAPAPAALASSPQAVALPPSTSSLPPVTARIEPTRAEPALPPLTEPPALEAVPEGAPAPASPPAEKAP
jgi:hypothetical protein